MRITYSTLTVLVSGNNHFDKQSEFTLGRYFYFDFHYQCKTGGVEDVNALIEQLAADQDVIRSVLVLIT